MRRSKPAKPRNGKGAQQTASQERERLGRNYEYIWKGKLYLRQKRRKYSASFVDSHSLRNGFSVSAVKDGRTKIVMNLKNFLITIRVTYVNAWSELMLILND
jgi:hypothetical protein